MENIVDLSVDMIQYIKIKYKIEFIISIFFLYE